MKLRSKISIILFSLWCIVITMAYFGSQVILNKSYLELERKQAESSLQRINEAIDQSASALATVLATWAIWDDAYQFATDLNETFIKTNLVVTTLAAIDIDDFLIYDTKGKPIYTMAINTDRTKEIPMPQALLDYLEPLLQQVTTNGTKFQGLAATTDGISLVVAGPIMTSNNTGPSRGTMVMIKDLSSEVVGKIQDVTKLNLAIFPLSLTKKSEQLKQTYGELSQSKTGIIERTSDTSLTGYSLLKDIYNKPVAIVKALMPRTVYQVGLNTLLYYNSIFVIYSIFLMALLWLLLQKLVVDRLERLKAQIGNIDENNHYFNNLISGIADEVSSVASLYHQATHDPLTGLANRNLLEQAFKNSTSKVNFSHTKMALLFLDIDHFKRVNDTLGHEVGDQLLVEISRLLSSCLRDHDLAVRLGGDEFVVMLVDIDTQKLTAIIERIYQSLAKPVYINDHELYLTSSMGISIYPDDGKDISALLKNADIALYHAKESGRNHYQYYSDELNKVIQETYKKEAELQRAIDNKELCLFYQPIYDVFTKRIISVEALIRWRHPERGLLSAGEIIPLAEKSGLIVPIGKWVLATACKQAKTWHDKGMPLIPVAVNISVLQTKNTSINRVVSEILQHTGLDPHLLELELTETSYVEITESILDDLRLLRDKGVTLAVDDFGVGYSGLGYLRSLPISKLKIDRSFIKDVLSDPDDSAITLAIIAIAHQLDLQVVAEGVETIAHFDFLKMHHVDAAQGNYLCRPLDVTACEGLLVSLNQEKIS